MKHCESDVERQITRQGIHFCAFWKREGSFKKNVKRRNSPNKHILTSISGEVLTITLACIASPHRMALQATATCTQVSLGHGQSGKTWKILSGQGKSGNIFYFSGK